MPSSPVRTAFPLPARGATLIQTGTNSDKPTAERSTLAAKRGQNAYNTRLARTFEPMTKPMTSLPTTQSPRLALLQDKPRGQLLIHEVYRSIQGESTFAGLPCVFVRLAVCDARCRWCDTPHAFTQGS